MSHGRKTLQVALKYGWLPGARYTNLRDIKGFRRIGLIDDWGSYDFSLLAHAMAVEEGATVYFFLSHSSQKTFDNGSRMLGTSRGKRSHQE